MAPLNWEDVPQGDTSQKQNSSSFKASMGTPWFGATIFLIALIVGFALGNL